MHLGCDVRILSSAPAVPIPSTNSVKSPELVGDILDSFFMFNTLGLAMVG